MKVTSKQAYEWVKTGHWSFRQFKEWVEDSDYAYPTIQDYEEIVGFKVGDPFKMGFTMARTTNKFIEQLCGETK